MSTLTWIEPKRSVDVGVLELALRERERCVGVLMNCSFAEKPQLFQEVSNESCKRVHVAQSQRVYGFSL